MIANRDAIANGPTINRGGMDKKQQRGDVGEEVRRRRCRKQRTEIKRSSCRGIYREREREREVKECSERGKDEKGRRQVPFCTLSMGPEVG
jgi:hypothetical protein